MDMKKKKFMIVLTIQSFTVGILFWYFIVYRIFDERPFYPFFILFVIIVPLLALAIFHTIDFLYNHNQ